MIKLLTVTFFLILNFSFFSQNGIVKTYFSTGKVESRVAFVGEVLEGTSYWYFGNGYIKTEKNYSNGKLNGLIRNYYDSGLLKDEIRYSNGMLHGVSRKYYENGALSEVITYENGQLITLNQIDFDPQYIAPLSAYEAGKKKNKLENNDFLCSIEICPEPIGGIEEIESNIVYPELAKQYNLEGSVLVLANISKRGVASKIRVIKSLGLGCDEAAIQAVKNTKFIPGMNKGNEVESEVSFSLNFRIPKIEENLIAQNNSGEIASEESNKNRIGIEANKKFITCDAEICAEPEEGIIGLLNKLRYPPNAKRNKISGDVIVKAKINELGFVISTEIVKSLGSGCDEAAQSAIIKTQFTPAKSNGIDIESIVEIVVPFILKENE